MSLFQSTEENYLREVPENYLLAWVCNRLSLNKERLRQILKLYNNSLIAAIADDFSEIASKGAKWAAKWKGFGKLESLESFLKTLDKHKIEVVSFFDDKYPASLEILDRQPLVLYYQGDIDLLEKTGEMLTVVGARNYTKYAEILLNKILKPACQSGVGVVSGLALGIDGLSHGIALEGGAKTIGVIGSGLDEQSFYPFSNWSLKREIVEKGGLVMSEYAPGIKPTVYNFPERNKILAAFTELTWVVQAAEKSGSLITSSVARDLGKTVATTPGSVFEATLKGNLKLIKDGANIITEMEDIFQLLNLTLHKIPKVSEEIKFGDEKEEKVYQFLSLSPQLTEQIAVKTGLSLVEINSALTMLELSGLVMSVGENRWVRCS